MHNSQKVGEILLEAGVIDEDQLELALVEQAQWGRRIGVTLIKLGMVEESHLIRALARQLGIPATSLGGKRIPPEVLALVPGRVATEQGVIPLFVKRSDGVGRLFLGMEDPSKHEVLDDLCFRTGLDIQPVMIGPTELSQAIDRYYAGPQAEVPDQSAETMQEVVLDEPGLGLHEPGLGIDDPLDYGLGSEGEEDDRESVEEDAVDEGASTDDAHETRPAAAEASLDGFDEASDEIERDEDDDLSFDEFASILPEDLIHDVGKAIDESEKTRLVLKAVTHLLVKKHLLTIDELQACVATLKDDAKES